MSECKLDGGLGDVLAESPFSEEGPSDFSSGLTGSVECRACDIACEGVEELVVVGFSSFSE